METSHSFLSGISDEFDNITIKSEPEEIAIKQELTTDCSMDNEGNLNTIDTRATYCNTLRSIAVFFGYALKYAKARGKINLGMTIMYYTMSAYEAWNVRLQAILSHFHMGGIAPTAIRVSYPIVISQSKLRQLSNLAQSRLAQLKPLITQSSPANTTRFARMTDDLIAELKLVTLLIECLSNNENQEMPRYEHVSVRLNDTDVVFREVIRAHSEARAMFDNPTN